MQIEHETPSPRSPSREGPRPGLRSLVLLAGLVVIGGGLAAWKATEAQGAGAAPQAEPMERVTAAVVTEREHQGATTAIGTVLALRSVTLRNELAGTVREVRMAPGGIVEDGQVLVALDVSVEEAELRALHARAELARTTLERYERMAEQRAVSAIERDQARAERDIAEAEIARVEAVIERKTIRAPFRARVGLADVHPGQFLDAGTRLTTLQGVARSVHVDFQVAQSVAEVLRPGDEVQVLSGEGDGMPVSARITAVDARIDPATRNAAVRVRVDEAGPDLTPGASVRVRVPVGGVQTAPAVPVDALRRGPSGDHVFVLEADGAGATRAHVRQIVAGPVLGDEVLILEGLRPGERVAAAGSFKLREGVLVNTGEAPEDAAARAPTGQEPEGADHGQEPAPAAHGEEG